MRGTSLSTFIFVLSVLSVSTAWSQDPQYLALITDLEGTVMVSKAPDGAFQPVVWGTQLFQDDRVKTLETAGVSLLFSNNNLITLGANSALTIAAGPVPATSTPKTVNGALLADVTDLTMRRTREGDLAALGGLRSGSSDQGVELLSPRNTKVKTTQPTFIWHAQQPFETYRVKLLDSDGLVWSGETTENRLDYPEQAPPLKPDTPYFWHVEAEEILESVQSPTVTFRVLSEEALQEIASNEAAIGQMFSNDMSGSNYPFLLGAYYAKEGLLASAIDAFLQIAEQHPDAALAYEILGKLYHDIGLKDHAIEALQHAIVLSRKN